MRLIRYLSYAIIFGLCTLALSVVGAEAVQPLAAISNQARDFLLAQHAGRAEPPEVRVGPLDPRLRLAACGAELEVFLPNSARALGNTSVGVRCPGPQPWTVYLSARVRLFGEVLVASRFLRRGTLIAAADLSVERRDLSTLPGGFETVSGRLIGKQLKRSLQAGAVIPPRAVAPPLSIRRGEQVIIRVHQADMEVSARGIALRDAALGERLQVRNASSKRVIEGTVIPDHQIEVKF